MQEETDRGQKLRSDLEDSKTPESHSPIGNMGNSYNDTSRSNGSNTPKFYVNPKNLDFQSHTPKNEIVDYESEGSTRLGNSLRNINSQAPIDAEEDLNLQKKSESSGKKELERIKSVPQRPISRNGSKAFLSPFRRPTLTRNELKQCGSIVKALRRHPQAGPFLEPVDYKKEKLPDYPTIIKKPMDIDTIDKKLIVCQYETVEEFFNDIQLIFDNCYLYNGRDAPISMMASELEKYFNKFKRDFSHATDILEQTSSSATQRTPVSKPKPKSSQTSRKNSTAQPINRSGDIYRDELISSSKKLVSKYSMPEPQYKFCLNLVKEFFKKHHQPYAFPFLEPVDWKAMNIPDYPQIVKNPMDLSTIERKLEGGKYTSPLDFETDIRLMFNNCYKYNPPSGQVYLMGKKLESIFDKKWAQRPTTSKYTPINDGLSSDDTSEDEPPLIKKKPNKPSGNKSLLHEERYGEVKKRKLELEPTRPKPIKNTVSHKQPRNGSDSKPKPIAEITYEQKKQLSLAINELSGDMLNVVVELIQSSMPDLSKTQSEIELDIDSLDSKTLSNLYNYVMKATSGSSSIKPPKPLKEPKPQKRESGVKRQREPPSTEDKRHEGSKSKKQQVSRRQPLSSSSSSSGSGSDSDTDSTASSGESGEYKLQKRLEKRIDTPTSSKKQSSFFDAKAKERISTLKDLYSRDGLEAKTQKLYSQNAISGTSDPFPGTEPPSQAWTRIKAEAQELKEKEEALKNKSNEQLLLERKEKLLKRKEREEKLNREIEMRKKQIEAELAFKAQEARKIRAARSVVRIDLLRQKREVAELEEFIAQRIHEDYLKKQREKAKYRPGMAETVNSNTAHDFPQQPLEHNHSPLRHSNQAAFNTKLHYKNTTELSTSSLARDVSVPYNNNSDLEEGELEEGELEE